MSVDSFSRVLVETYEFMQSSNGAIDTKANSSDEASSSDDEERWREKPRKAEDLPSEYWSLQKLIKYIKAGNQVATNACLCCIRDYDLTVQINQLAIFKVGGLEIMVNLLRSNDLVCRKGALYILKSLTKNIDMRRYVIDLNAIDSLVLILDEPGSDIKAIAADVLANLAKVRVARRIIRNLDGISKVINQMDITDGKALQISANALTARQCVHIQLSIAASNAMISLMSSKRNMKVAIKAGLIGVIVKLLNTKHAALMCPVMNICQLFSSEVTFLLALQTEMIFDDIVNNLRSSELDIIIQTCLTIFKCARDVNVRALVAQTNTVELLHKIVAEDVARTDERVVFAATGAICQCALLEENARRFDELHTIDVLIKLVETEYPDETMTNICGAIAEILKVGNNAKLFCASKAFGIIANLLNFPHDAMLVSVARLLERCAQHDEYAKKLADDDVVRLLWSLLRNTNPDVISSASWALCEYIRHDANSGEMIRSLVGALELVASLLSVDDHLILTAICALIAEIALDDYNVAILTDYNVIRKLANLVQTKDEALQETLAAAIASCAPYGTNTQLLGELRTVTPIVRFMAGTNAKVHRTTAMALEKLSADPLNCVTMHQDGVVPFLLECVGSRDEILQRASTNCLNNLRRLALDADMALLM